MTPSPNPSSIPTIRSILLLLLTTTTTFTLLPLTIASTSTSTSIPRPPYLGPRDRLWRHHKLQHLSSNIVSRPTLHFINALIFRLYRPIVPLDVRYSMIRHRSSEHLTYDNFPSLAHHTDGPATAYTVNYSFSNPEEYDGGYLYLIDSVGTKTLIKPSRASCVVFLGGHTVHGVTEIKGGNGGRREAFSTETWYNPDPPIGTTLWTTTPESMEEYVLECNRVSGRHWERGEGCEVEFSDLTPSGVSLEDSRKGNFRDGGYGGYGGGKPKGGGMEKKKKVEKKEVKSVGAVKRGEEDQKEDSEHEETPNDQPYHATRETHDDYNYDYDYNEDYTYERPQPPEPE